MKAILTKFNSREGLSMRKNTRFIILLLLIVSCLAGCKTQTSDPEAAADDWLPELSEPYVSVTGKVIPRQWALLSPPIGGTIASLDVAEGDSVDAGRPLLALASDQVIAQVAQAQSGLDAALAALATLEAGATAEQNRSRRGGRAPG